MNREQRVRHALALKPVDRVPVSAWMHFSQFDQDPISLAETQVAFNEKYDFDFIKMMPFGTYSVQDWGAQLSIYCDRYKEPIVATPAIKEVSDYGNLRVFPAIYGTWGKQLQLAQYMSKLVSKDTPYIQTIFSPFSTLKKLAGNQLFSHFKEFPEKVHVALAVITETTNNFVKANIEAGVSGFFFATQNATYDLMNDEDFDEFALAYDLQVIDTYRKKTYFNVIHMHGDHIMFDKVAAKYPLNCLNWHDRHTKPSMKEARKTVNKCFLGGIQEVPYFVGNVLHYDSILATKSASEIEKHAKEALEAIGDIGVILGPGCVVDPRTPEKNLMALRNSVNR